MFTLLVSQEQGGVTQFSRGVYLRGIDWVLLARLGMQRCECAPQMTK